MHVGLITAVDQRLTRLAVARLRRRAPLLRVVPVRVLGAVARPRVRRARRTLSMAAAAVAAAAPLATQIPG